MLHLLLNPDDEGKRLADLAGEAFETWLLLPRCDGESKAAEQTDESDEEFHPREWLPGAHSLAQTEGNESLGGGFVEASLGVQEALGTEAERLREEKRIVEDGRDHGIDDGAGLKFEAVDVEVLEEGVADVEGQDVGESLNLDDSGGGVGRLGLWSIWTGLVLSP